MGMLGMYGFYEAVDLTPARLAVGQEIAIVQSYMAHHQGMIMLSLVNYLRRKIWSGASSEPCIGECRICCCWSRFQEMLLMSREIPKFHRDCELRHRPIVSVLASESKGTPAQGALPLEWSLRHPDYRCGWRV